MSEGLSLTHVVGWDGKDSYAALPFSSLAICISRRITVTIQPTQMSNSVVLIKLPFGKRPFRSGSTMIAKETNAMRCCGVSHCYPILRERDRTNLTNRLRQCWPSGHFYPTGKDRNSDNADRLSLDREKRVLPWMGLSKRSRIHRKERSQSADDFGRKRVCGTNHRRRPGMTRHRLTVHS